MGRCIIESCRNYSHKTRTTDKSTKYHAFPKDVGMRSEWIKALQNCGWIPESNAYICSEHFLPTDFERDLKAELLKLPPKKILKPEAVPSVNLPEIDEEGVNCNDKEFVTRRGENKENVTKTSNYDTANGYIISYKGKPRIMITNTSSKSTDGHDHLGSNSQSKIISLDQFYNFTKSPFSLNKKSSVTGNNKNFLENKNLFKLEDLCRLCGSYSNRMTQIFSNTKSDFFEIIEDYFPEIKIEKDDILPAQICSNCETSLSSWHQFFKTCNTVNKRFQSILKKLMQDPEVQEKLPDEEMPDQSKDDMKDIHTENMSEDIKLFCDEEEENEIEIVEVSPELLVSQDSEEPKQVSNAVEGPNKTQNVDEESKNTLNVEVLQSMFGDEERDDSETESALSESSLEVDWKVIKQERKRRRRLQQGGPRMCHMCGNTFKYSESLRRHLKTVHSELRPFQCNLCDATFNRNHNLTIHIKVVHQRQRLYPKTPVPRLCDYCGKVLLSSRSLEEHISCMHTKDALYECEKCHSHFFRKLSFEKHKSLIRCDLDVKPVRTTPTKKDEVFLKYCEICGLEFKKEHFYLKHKMKHMTSFSCPVCEEKFDERGLWRDHLNAEHPEIFPFVCSTCGKKFKTKGSLNSHAVIHFGEKRYQCEYCSLKFLKKKYLTAHILTHTGERPFVCTICNKGFKQSGDMRKHKATHIRKQL